MKRYQEIELSVCTVCVHLIANGEYTSDEGDERRASDGMAKLWGPLSVHIVLGGEHSDTCTEADQAEGCDCGELGFSTTDCDTCGDHLHGDRFQATALIPRLVGKAYRDRRHAFVNGYVDAMVWVNVSDGTDTNEYADALSIEDKRSRLTWDALGSMVHDALGFLEEQLPDLHWAATLLTLSRGSDLADAWSHLGYDFALTRNGHGVGYWDRGLGDVGDRLSAAAGHHGEATLFYDGERITA